MTDLPQFFMTIPVFGADPGDNNDVMSCVCVFFSSTVIIPEGVSQSFNETPTLFQWRGAS